ncbi:MAG: phosphatidate cytidylyltransferase [Treponema sp.]|nr:phosphatidate cytidylyltransferase [Treponema sp.]
MRKYRTKLLLKELFRKSIHLCAALVPSLLDRWFILTIILLFLALAAYSICEFFRLKGIKIPLVSKITEIAARQRDEDKFVLGPVTLVLGIILAAFSISNPEARRIGIYALAFGDGLASLCGKFFGRVHIPGTKGKTVAGSLACWTAVFISTFHVMPLAPLAFATATAAMIIELLPLADMDNIIIPPLIGWFSIFFCLFVMIGF